MNTESTIPSDLIKDLSKLLKEEGDFVKDLTSVATRGAEFHARLEAIEKALRTDPSSYSSNETDDIVSKAKDKYKSELEGNMKDKVAKEMNS